MTEQLRLRGTLKGHGGWVTQIATTPAIPDMILSSSRGGVVCACVWLHSLLLTNNDAVLVCMNVCLLSDQ